MNSEAFFHRLSSGTARRILAVKELVTSRHVRMPRSLERKRQELLSFEILFPCDRHYKSVLKLQIRGCGLKDKLYIHLATSIAWCIEHNAFLDWNGDLEGYGHWNDWFRPFVEDLDHSGLPTHLHQPDWHEMSPFFRRLVKRYSSQFIQNIWHLNEETKRDVAAQHADLIPPVPYAAIQIRRGDKLKWGQIQRVSPENIVTAIPGEAEVLWVATDDYSAVEELRSLFPRPVLTSCLPSHRGSDTLTHHFLEGEASHLRAETMRLLTDLECCRKADWFLRILPHRKLSQNGHSRNLQIADMISDLRFGQSEILLS